MPYYHVLIESYESSEPYYELDKTDLSEIKDEFIIPYLKGEQFVFSGYFLDEAKVKRIVIGESAYTSKEYVIEVKRRRGPNVFLPIPREGIIKRSDYTKDITRNILKECRSLLQEATPQPEAPTVTKPKAPMDKSKVFIVHGHDEAARLAVAGFIEKLDLEAIILDEQASSGRTIIEKIEANTNVGFGIVLYTPCDLGTSQKKGEQLKPRARQNVVFEHGYLIGKIGRKNVCALVKGDIEKPTDISGVVYIPMDEGGGWKLAVGKELQACGYEFDPNKLLK
ncbi:TIR domain-containing protein [Porphyromonas catoniae]|jgi:putative nucleotide-binding protein containing TIR-like domain|uniref:CD-NTase-associated protein 12/Pycsar effector protein TIR domain-containing protein n=1 Tax=Porphyromonas catoniae ATCC 51270 TaxID=887901 RepID=Z4WPK6_9PORP|nr:nucleotide-binding protein [Porphyromonas catoniae]EWC91521.1 hypothetical protein HMPREF0636_0462 [Porphyromonas catoniae ATCC 51270]